MEGEIKNIVEVWLSIIASLCYSYFISSKIPKGFYRLFSLLPIFLLFTFLPLYLSSAFLTAVTALITWLANSNLLLFAFGRGPLSQGPPISLPLFITIASLPIKIRSTTIPKSSKPKKLPLNIATEVLAFSILMGVVYRYKDRIHPKILLVLYICLVFLLIDILIAILIAISSAVVRLLVGLELEPPSDEPYLSTSLQDFWGRRWNLIVTNALRHTVFEPVRTAFAPVFGKWAPPLAVLATFAVSGLMHELLFFYLTRVTPTWEMTGFFVLHGVCVVVEFAVKRALAGKLRLPWIVSAPLTVGFVVATSSWLFFPPLVRGGADVKVIEEFKVFVEFVTATISLKSLFRICFI